MLYFVKDIALTVWGYLRADWMILLLGIVIAVTINVYVDPIKLKQYIEKKAVLSIPGSVAFGAFTPLCACGTMAVLLSMFISAMPWGPVMTFLVSSPLTSPSEFMFETAFFGTEFAIAVLVASVILGLAAGFSAHFLQKRTGYFQDQFRIGIGVNSCCTSEDDEAQLENCCCSEQSEVIETSFLKKYKLDRFIKEFYQLGIKKILLLFILFISVGRIVELMIPKEWIMMLFSSDKSYSIPLGATIGLPLYISGSSALPLIKSFINSGAGQGAVLAFLITGKATGVPVIVGMSTILKKRAILFYVGFVYLGGMLSGYVYQVLLSM